MRCQSQLLQWNGLASSQNPHHHVLDTACRRNRGNAQFDIKWAVFFELDLPVLGFAPLRNIQIAHDFQARHHCLTKMGWNLDVRHQTTVDSKPDAGFEFARHRLNVDIGHLLVVRVNDDLIDKFHQFVVCSSRFESVFFARTVVQRGPIHVCQHVIDGPRIGYATQNLIHRLLKLSQGGHPV